MKALVFETPGELDLRALTLMGVSAKPGADKPIGMFGTGLKYSVAVLCRLGAPPAVWIGRKRYAFVVRADSFRGAEIQAIDLIGPVDRRELPYTTEYGKFWEPWMVYRELESNTIDEGGCTFVEEFADEDDLARWQASYAEHDVTRVIVTQPDVVSQHDRREEVFLEHLGEPLVETREVRAWARPSLSAWYRGLKVHDLGKRPSMMTYDLQQAALTEDRTLKSLFQLRSAIPGAIIRLEDEALIYQLLTAGDGVLEGDLDWDYLYEPPSDAFRRALERAKTKVSRSVRNYQDRVFPAPVVSPPDPFGRWPRPWRLDDGVIRDANENPLPAAGHPEYNALLEAITVAVNSARRQSDGIPF